MGLSLCDIGVGKFRSVFTFESMQAMYKNNRNKNEGERQKSENR